MRGEDKKVTKEGFQISGSPPHARGRPALLFRRFPDFGITPACAGKTQSAPSARSATPDHPRMRGEDRGSMRAGLSVQGSPPHARGRLRPLRRTGLSRGITPACAGKTNGHSLSTFRARDHPRMRGEDPCAPADERAFGGSPPHARGRPTLISTSTSLTRITPACAGKTWTGWARSGGMADHPRMRGEDGLGARLPGEAGGSPPHARGRPSSLMSTILVDWITPACAGKTPPRRFS